MCVLPRPHHGWRKQCWHKRNIGRYCRSCARRSPNRSEPARTRRPPSHAWPACLVFSQQRYRRANLTRSAIPALHSIMAYKCGLHRVQDAVFFQTLYGRDLVACMHHGERQAAIDALSIDHHRAGAALSLVATLLRTGQPAQPGTSGRSDRWQRYARRRNRCQTKLS